MAHGVQDAPLLRATARESVRALPEQVRVARLRRVSGAAGIATLTLGLTVIAGWVFGVPLMTMVAPGLVTMKFNAAAALTGLGLCVWLLSRDACAGRTLWTLSMIAGAVVVLGGATLVQYAFTLDLGIDNPFHLDRTDATGTSQPGRMSPVSAVCLAGLGGAVLAIVRERTQAAQWVAGGALTISIVAVIGYLFNLEPLYRVSIYTSMAVHTAVALSLLSLAVLGLRADRGFMLLVAGDTIGGVLLRRALPWVLLLPTALGALLVVGLEHNWYDDRFALAVLATLVTVAGCAITWILGRQLRNVDLRRADAEEMRERLQASLAERGRLAAQLISSEKHARDIVENSADAYIAVSPSGRVVDWNGAAARLFGWSRSEAVGQLLDSLMIPPELAALHRAGISRAAEDGTGPLLGRSVELPALHRDGHRLLVELTTWAVRADAGWGFHAFLRDVTARKAAETELQRMNDDLRQFAGVVAHDLRTPLTTIAGYAELLRDTRGLSDIDPHALEWAERIEGAALRGADLIADLLAFTQIGLGDLTTEPVDLEALIDEVVREQRSLRQDDASIQVATLPTVMGDAGLLRQLFSNLIGNALKYGGNGSDTTANVCIGATPSTESGRVVVQVSDDGPGIAAAERAQIFDMFQRGSEVGSISGTGIGLAISRQVVERHHGRIWIEDSELGGAAFYVELPAVPVPR